MQAVAPKTTLGERVEAVIKRSWLGQNAFGRKAGVSSPVLSRYKSDTNRTATKRSGDILKRIATAGNASLDWLTSGEGDIEENPSEPTDNRYPSKQPAAKMLRGVVDDEAIEAMLSEEHYGSTADPGADYWIDRAQWWHQRRHKAIAAVSGPGVKDPTEESPPMEARPRSNQRTKA